ncbi:MAG: lytic transglycosylase domain-containing protein [Rhodocyclaceae bacterium]|nr:lytic transglycosylase domain-containing protein [Rhodocyclaceae bacterium]
MNINIQKSGKTGKYLYRLLPGLLLLCLGQSQAAPGDEAFLQARDAFASGNRVKLARALDGLQTHDLRVWAEYYQLRQQMDENPAGIPDFLAMQSGSLPAERLRSDWIKSLGKRGRWDEVAREYPLMVQPDQETQCYGLQARLQQDDAAALGEARPLWFGTADLVDACRPLMDALVTRRMLNDDDVWERVRRMLESKKPKQALQAARYLPDAQMPDPRAIDAISDNPMRFLARLPNKYFEEARKDRGQRETLLFAIARIAANDPASAADQFEKFADNFPAAERAYGWGQIALQAARRHMPDTLSWFARTEATTLSEEQLAWWVRAALRANNWVTVRRAIARMPAALANQPDWVYWQARALATQGHRAEAAALYQRIAGQPNFYGSLASEELGQPISAPPRAAPVTPQELGEAMANEGLRRALALLRLDVRLEGVREWNWSLRGMTDRQLLAAAELARRNDVYDRAISAADRTQVQHDYAVRYLAPYRDKVEPKARELALDPGWVYGLMRQESRFVIQARSTVGAQGLMQVMPATASWVAKKIGLADYHPKRAMDIDTNVILGTNYMRMVLDGLDNHPVLASAAYNAGPGRAKRWRADVPLEGAIYAESIPFSETRDYVKKVMSNTVFYNALFENKPQSLKSRLGVIRPRGNGDAEAEALP